MIEKVKIIKAALWVFLALNLALMGRGAAMRISNENRNKSVVPVADYYSFLDAANKAGMANGAKAEDEAGMANDADAANGAGAADGAGDEDVLRADMEGVLARLKDAGVKTVAVREKAVFESGGRIGKNNAFSGKAGFDEAVLDKLKSMGFEIVLRPFTHPAGYAGYDLEYEQIIRDYGIKYMVFDGPEEPGAYGGVGAFKDIVKQYGIIVGIIEAPSQIGYVKQRGLEGLIVETGYAVNRVYIAPTKDLSFINPRELALRWLRGVVDRNVRFVYIEPLKNPEVSYSGNIDGAIEAAEGFNRLVCSKGYALNGRIEKLYPGKPGKVHYFAVFLSLLFASALYAAYLFGWGKRLAAAFAAAVPLAVAAFLILKAFSGFGPIEFLAMCASVLYPSFSSLLLLKYLKGNREKPLVVLLPASLGLMLGINAPAMYTVVATLCDIRYTMNIELYRGVLISFVAPLGFFTLNYFLTCGRHANADSLSGFLCRLPKRRISFLHIAALAAGAAALYVYLGRSGQNIGVSALPAEVKIRETLEMLFLARPRIKEFLIGYPALFAMVYLYRGHKKDIILFILGFGVVAGGISMVNSFCHVFTPVEVSVWRTAGGLVIGIMLGAALIALMHAAEGIRRTFSGTPR